MLTENAHVKDAFGYELNTEEAAMIMAGQISTAAASTDSEMHTVTAVKVGAVGGPCDPLEMGSPMEDDDVGEQSLTKLEPNTKSEQVFDRAPISEADPPVQPRPDVPEERT